MSNVVTPTTSRNDAMRSEIVARWEHSVRETWTTYAFHIRNNVDILLKEGVESFEYGANIGARAALSQTLEYLTGTPASEWSDRAAQAKVNNDATLPTFDPDWLVV